MANHNNNNNACIKIPLSLILNMFVDIYIGQIIVVFLSLYKNNTIVLEKHKEYLFIAYKCCSH